VQKTVHLRCKIVGRTCEKLAVSQFDCGVNFGSWVGRAPPASRGMLSGMERSEPAFPDLPGWRFSLTETSMGVYRAEGYHADGRSVSRMGHDLPLLIKETLEDAQSLPERRHAPRS
jgi:hypothetical protein